MDADNPSRTAGTVSLVLGILSVFPFGLLAGIPAIVVAIRALRNEPRSRTRARVGAVLGGFGILITAALVVNYIADVSMQPNPPIGDAGATSYNMYNIQGSLDEWATENGGAFPYKADFDSDSSRFMEFLARDQVIRRGKTVAGRVPVNVYSKAAYRYGVDLFYFPDSLAAGANRFTSTEDSACPYRRLSAPQGKPGTIVILGHTDRSGTWPRVTEYGIVGFDKDASQPMKDSTAPNRPYLALCNDKPR
ncbi:MAG TPA: DUF4190 domain-containing protein [bacterium]|nr:DUF4190 domain-containing protein [bacterium]